MSSDVLWKAARLPAVDAARVARWLARARGWGLWAAGLLAGLNVLLFLASAWQRVRFPFDIDDVGMLLEVQRVHAGLPLYVPPTVGFTPFLYTPIYFYAASAMAHVTGLSYAALRSVSVLATLGCFGLIYALVWRETRRHVAALVGVGLFAEVYPVVLQWFDIGRVDMLYLLFVLAALYAARWWHPAVAAVLWVAAFQTKQGVLPIALLALCHDWRRPERSALGVASFVGLLFASLAWMNHATGGWYGYYLFHLVSGFGYDLHSATRFLTEDLLAVDGVALLVVLAALLLAPVRGASRATWFYGLTSVGMIVFTGYVRAHRGAAQNAVLPAYLWIAVLAALALARLLRVLEARGGEWPARATVLVLAAVVVQLAMHVYSPREFTPKAWDYANRTALVGQLRQIPGDVLVASHPEVAGFAGKAEAAQIDATGAVIDATDHAKGDPLMAEYWAMVHGTRWGGVVLDRTAEQILLSPRSWMPPDFALYYPLKVRVAGEQETVPALGFEPRWIYMPCRLAGVAVALDPLVDQRGCAGTGR